MAIRKEKVQFFETILEDYLSKSGRHELPWRRRGITPYEVWVSEIMLQQTQVRRVIDFYERFIQRFPTVESLAESSWEEFLPYYEGLGYYSRGRNMIKTAKAVVSKHGGMFPKEKEALLTLPGIGPYTASAIQSFAYGKKALAWDTNLKRVVGRFFFGSKKAVINEAAFENIFTSPRKKLNAALMDFGSSICTSKPKCANCPLQRRCVYFQENGKREVEPAKERITFSHQESSRLVFLHENHRIYYSSQKKRFHPFQLPKGFSSRADIKEYFLQKYNLKLSVRPPHAKSMLRGKPVVLVNAQILSGSPKFPHFPKEAVGEYTRRNVK